MSKLLRRSLRWGLRAAAVSAALALGLGFATLTGVDDTPYMRAGYYAAALQQIARLQPADLAPEPIEAGFAKVNLTPTLSTNAANTNRGQFVNLPLAGYGGRRGRPATGTHDPLFARAIAFRVGARRLVMIAAEALIVPRAVAETTARQLRDRCGLDRAEVYLGATHTHASFGGWGEGPVGEMFAGKFDAGVPEWFADRLTEAGEAALADLQSASVGSRHFHAPDLVRNRLVGELGRVDPRFDFLLVRQSDGDRAVIGAYAAHATVLSDAVLEFSGDYPGAWSRALEASGARVAAFFAGAVGSHSPIAGAEGTRFEAADRMGQTLAARTLEAYADLTLTNRAVLATLGLEPALARIQPRVTDGLCLRPWIARRLLPVQQDTWLQAARIGDALWIATPCDFSGELALPLKAELRSSGLEPVITSFNGDYIGYIIPGRYYHLDGYEPRTMSFHGPHTADYLSELILRMAQRLGATP